MFPNLLEGIFALTLGMRGFLAMLCEYPTHSVDMLPERFGLVNAPKLLPKRNNFALLQIRNFLRRNDG